VGEVADRHLVYCRIDRDGAILYVRRRQGVFLAGRWELPGGSVETGESHESAAVREIHEETGLRVTVKSERGRHNWMDVTGKPVRIHARIFDVAEDGRAKVVLSPDEHDEFAWVAAADIATLQLADHFRH